jgi:hypothetical protein
MIGGGKRILSLAAREANIVSLDPIATPKAPKIWRRSRPRR